MSASLLLQASLVLLFLARPYSGSFSRLPLVLSPFYLSYMEISPGFIGPFSLARPTREVSPGSHWSLLPSPWPSAGKAHDWAALTLRAAAFIAIGLVHALGPVGAGGASTLVHVQLAHGPAEAWAAHRGGQGGLARSATPISAFQRGATRGSWFLRSPPEPSPARPASPALSCPLTPFAIASPEGHLQLKPLTLSLQMPPLTQGPLWHSSMSTSQ